MNNVICIGDKIELFKKSLRALDEEIFTNTYISQVLDIQGDILTAAVPIREGHIIPLEINSVYDACFFTKNGLYRAECKVKSRGKEDNIYIMELMLTTELERFQRREFFRLDCCVDGEMTILSSEESREYKTKLQIPETLEAQSIEVVIVDISGGGVRLVSKERVERGSDCLLKFPIILNGQSHTIGVMGKMISCSRSDEQFENFDIRVQFINLSVETREQIIKYIFDQQVWLRRKERGDETNA